MKSVNSMVRAIRMGVLVLLSALTARADVLNVSTTGGPGVFSSIQAAVDAARSGDTILVQGGILHDYGPFGVVIDGKGLSLIADDDLAARLFYEFGPGITIRNLPAGETVLLRGFIVVPRPFPLGQPDEEALLIEDCAADVWLEECVFVGASGSTETPGAHLAGWAGARILNCDAVTFVRCDVTGGSGRGPNIGGPGDVGGHAVEATSSSVFIYDASLDGGRGGNGALAFFIGGPSPGGTGGDGATLDGGLLFASGSTLTAGDGGNGTFESGACAEGGDGGCGLHVGGTGSHAVRLDTTAAGGDGGSGGAGGPPGCAPDGAAGQDLVVEAGGVSRDFAGSARHLIQSGVRREHESVSLAIEGVPGDEVFYLLNLGFDALWLPGRKGALLPDLTAPIVIGLGPLPASGMLAADLSVPRISGIDGFWLHAQAALFGAADGWVLSSPSATLLLDDSF